MPPQSPEPRSTRSSATGARSRARRDQLVSITLGAVLLGAALLLQKSTLEPQRNQLVKESSETSLQSLAVAFPRLTLGGFRGLLSTTLWIQAENDKNDRKWVELETKYDMIGSLQPYFISVYVFHSWNQAYNLSAQWHDQDTKYKWVLDGLAYLYKGEDYNPRTPDILVEQGHMYFLKLGGAFERLFYRAHWRSDIARFYQFNDSSLKDKPDNIAAIAHVHDFVMRVPPENRDAYAAATDPIERQKLREFHTAELRDPSGLTTKTGFGVSIIDPDLFEKRTDGLAPTDPMPFRFGLSPFYFAYISYRRTLAAGEPSTTAIRVVDSWPAMSLRLWCRDDLLYSEQSLLALFGPGAIIDSVDPNDRDARAAVAAKESEILDCYRNISLIGPKALTEFGQHLLRYPMNKYIHKKHMLETTSMIAMGKAEETLVKALIAWQANDRKLTPEVIRAFTDTLPLYDDAITKGTAWVDEIYPIHEGQPYNPERQDSEKYVTALRERKRGVENLLRTSPTEKPDLNFLKEETVER